MLRPLALIALGVVAQACVTGVFYVLTNNVIDDAGTGYAAAYVIALAACGAAAAAAVARDWLHGTTHGVFVVVAALIFLFDTAYTAISLYSLRVSA
jgi:hypothetical protein